MNTNTHSPETHSRAAPAQAAPSRDELCPAASLRLHPQADKVPALPTDHYLAFQTDIARRGITTPLEITYEHVVLDGRERLKAARALGIEELPVRVVAPADELEHMLLCALQRRQLSASQRAALALELERYQEVREQAETRRLQNLRPMATEVATLPPRGKTREIVAGWAGVSPRIVQDAATVQAHDCELFERVKAGEIAADQAARRIRRRQRDEAIGEPPPLPAGPFQLVYADPPWQLGNADGLNAPERHYPTLPLGEICAIQLPAADDALLLLWAVNCLLPEALQVVEAWGFSYKTNLVWVKPSVGLGNWVRNRHELLLLASRGSFPLAEPDLRFASVIEAARGRHSEKPAVVYELVERAWPGASKLELFARRARAGWTAWGNELEPLA